MDEKYGEDDNESNEKTGVVLHKGDKNEMIKKPENNDIEICKIGDVHIMINEMKNLFKNNILSDSIVDIALNNIYGRMNEVNKSQTYIFSTSLSHKLTSDNEIIKLKCPVNISKKKVLYFPTFKSNHWILVAVCFPEYIIKISPCGYQTKYYIMDSSELKLISDETKKLIVKKINGFMRYSFNQLQSNMNDSIEFRELLVTKQSDSSNSALYMIKNLEFFHKEYHNIYESTKLNICTYDQKYIQDLQNNIYTYLYNQSVEQNIKSITHLEPPKGYSHPSELKCTTTRNIGYKISGTSSNSRKVNQNIGSYVSVPPSQVKDLATKMLVANKSAMSQNNGFIVKEISKSIPLERRHYYDQGAKGVKSVNHTQAPFNVEKRFASNSHFVHESIMKDELSGKRQRNEISKSEYLEAINIDYENLRIISNLKNEIHRLNIGNNDLKKLPELHLKEVQELRVHIKKNESNILVKDRIIETLKNENSDLKATMTNDQNEYSSKLEELIEKQIQDSNKYSLLTSNLNKIISIKESQAKVSGQNIENLESANSKLIITIDNNKSELKLNEEKISILNEKIELERFENQQIIHDLKKENTVLMIQKEEYLKVISTLNERIRKMELERITSEQNFETIDKENSELKVRDLEEQHEIVFDENVHTFLEKVECTIENTTTSTPNMITEIVEKPTTKHAKSSKKSTVTKTIVKKSEKIVSDEKILCKYCQKPFAKKRYLNVHVNAVHEKKDMQKCPICSKVFYNKSNLIHHKLSHNEGTFKCPNQNCRKLFKYNSSLKYHKIDCMNRNM